VDVLHAQGQEGQQTMTAFARTRHVVGDGELVMSSRPKAPSGQGDARKAVGIVALAGVKDAGDASMSPKPV
jgi:hypothetical protein